MSTCTTCCLYTLAGSVHVQTFQLSFLIRAPSNCQRRPLEIMDGSVLHLRHRKRIRTRMKAVLERTLVDLVVFGQPILQARAPQSHIHLEQGDLTIGLSGSKMPWQVKVGYPAAGGSQLEGSHSKQCKRPKEVFASRTPLVFGSVSVRYGPKFQFLLGHCEQQVSGACMP